MDAFHAINRSLDQLLNQVKAMMRSLPSKKDLATPRAAAIQPRRPLRSAMKAAGGKTHPLTKSRRLTFEVDPVDLHYT